MGDLILMYVNDIDIDDPLLIRHKSETDPRYFSRQTPLAGSLNATKYPCMCLVVRTPRKAGQLLDQNMSQFVKIRRGLWTKWKAGDRDPQDNMYLFKYCDLNSRKLYKNLRVQAIPVGIFDSVMDIGETVRGVMEKYRYYSGCMIEESVAHIMDKYA